MEKLQTIVFVITIIYGGIYDYKHRIIPDKVHIIILVATLIANFSIYKSLTGLIFISIPFIVPIYFDYNSVGGGDIKLAGTIGFFLGARKGLITLIIALSVALFFNLVIFKKKGKDMFPLGPYVAIGSIISLII